MLVSGIKRVNIRYSGQSGRHSYAFDTDLPVKVGDTVIVPGNRWKSGDQTATVVGLDSTYGGPVKWIKALLT